MLVFQELIDAGASVAAISTVHNGNCGWTTCCSRDRQGFLSQCGVVADRLVAPKQVHGNRVVTVTESDSGQGAFSMISAIAEADALITQTPGLPLGITVADCVPVYLFDAGTRAAGLVHAGREGTFLRITQTTLQAMRKQFGSVPADMHVLIGPSACPECYEVSEAMAGAFRDAGFPTRGRHLDLWEANRLQCLAEGIPTGQIHLSGRCTITDPAFHSYRATGTSARNLAVLQL